MDYIKYKNLKIICDIDGTLCTDTKNKWSSAKPLVHNIERLNYLAKRNTIHLWTARPKTKRKLTEQQLKEWGVKYDSLELGKVAYHLWIDDRAICWNDDTNSPDWGEI